MKNLSNKNIIHVNDKGVEYIQFKKLLEYKDKIVHCYTIGTEKSYRTVVKEGETLEEKRRQTQENYRNLCNSIGADYEKLVYSNQLHTDRVECVENIKNFEQERIEVDGLCTNTKGITLSTINADCILFLFYDPVKNVIANIHSGWKGTLKRISIKTVQKMQKEYGCNPKDIICCISASIRKCHFEVQADVKDLYEKEFTDIEFSKEIIEETVPKQKWNIDTVLINKILLKRQGLLEQNIIDSGLCTVCNKEQIHSFRVEKKGYGVETAVIGLKK